MTWFRGLATFAVAIALVLGLCVIGVDAQKKKKRTRRTTKAAAPKPVITNPAIAPATTTDANGDIKIISTADQTSSEAEEPGAPKKPKSKKPARVKEEDSETPYMTRRGIDFIREAGEQPWCLHLSYIKPHWPYIAPEPYHAMFGAADVLPVVRSEEERQDPHPIYAEFMDLRVSKAFAREEVREEVIPVYMGLIKQIDDQLGRLFAFMQERGLLESTMIVFTSDHGDYLGELVMASGESSKPERTAAWIEEFLDAPIE
jgi:arylsulfatase A-like enzyme